MNFFTQLRNQISLSQLQMALSPRALLIDKQLNYTFTFSFIFIGQEVVISVLYKPNCLSVIKSPQFLT
jgi:hypothetical protein